MNAIFRMVLFMACAVPAIAEADPVAQTQPAETPEAVVARAVELMRSERQAITRRDSSMAESTLNELVELSDQLEIARRFASRPDFKAVLGKDLGRGYVSLWGAMLGYYLDDADFAKARRLPAGTGEVYVIVPASGPRSTTQLRFRLRDVGGRWLISEVGFMDPLRSVEIESAAATATAPTTQPADDSRP